MRVLFKNGFVVDAVGKTVEKKDIFVEDGIIRAIGAMEDAPEKRFTLPALARLAAMSVPNFTEKFRRHTGCSPIAYLTRLRLEKAGHLLETYDLPLSTVAANCGFCDSNYLIKLFRRAYGMTPSRYRRGIGADSGLG